MSISGVFLSNPCSECTCASLAISRKLSRMVLVSCWNPSRIDLTAFCEKQHKEVWTFEVSLEEIDVRPRTLNLQLQAIILRCKRSTQLAPDICACPTGSHADLLSLMAGTRRPNDIDNRRDIVGARYCSELTP